MDKSSSRAAVAGELLRLEARPAGFQFHARLPSPIEVFAPSLCPLLVDSSGDSIRIPLVQLLGMAIYGSDGGPRSIAFPVASYAFLVYVLDLAGVDARSSCALRRTCVWGLTPRLLIMFSHKVAALMPPTMLVARRRLVDGVRHYRRRLLGAAPLCCQLSRSYSPTRWPPSCRRCWQRAVVWFTAVATNRPRLLGEAPTPCQAS